MKKIVLLIAVFAITSQVWSQGADNCAGAQVLLPGAGNCDAFSNDENGFDGSNGFSSCGSGTDYADVWYQFTGTGNTMDIDISNLNQPDITMAVYTSCPGGYGSDVACTNITGTTGTISGPTVLGQTYYIRLHRVQGGGANPQNNNSTGDICLTDNGGGGGSSECANATPLVIACPGSVNVTGSTVGDTPQTEGTCVATAGTGGAIWYSFVSDGSVYTATTDNAGTDFDTKIWIFEGACGSLNCVDGDDDSGSGLTSTVSFATTAGLTYYVVVGGFSSDEGNYDMDISSNGSGCSPSSVNDDCSGAIAVTPDGSCQNGSILLGDGDSWVGEAGCATTGAPEEHLDVWYSFVATGGVFDITATDISIGGDLEIVLAAPGAIPCVDAFTIIASYCGASPVTGNFAGLVTGNTYYYTVSSPSLQTGDFTTCVTTTPISNDECAGAIPVAVGTNGICVEVEGTNAGASASGGVGAPSCGGYAGGDVWYSIVVPASGEVTFAVDFAAANSLGDADIAIYYGPCGSLTEIDCDDNSGTGSMPNIQATGLTPGATVYVRVWDFGNDDIGSFDLCFSEPPQVLSNQDCVTALPICSTAQFGGASNGSGGVVDLDGSNMDCLFGENQTSWLYLEITIPGDFMFTISPDNGTDDYDFALWHYPGGLGQTCPPSALADRCSYSAGSGFGGSYDTGLDDGTIVGGGGPGETSETSAGDNWVDELPVSAGDAVMLVIDNFSSTTSPYTLNFTGSAGLDCTILPSEYLSYFVKANGPDNDLKWVTLTEVNNAYFTIEHSLDGKDWAKIGQVSGAGNSNEKLNYGMKHMDVQKRVNYYRMYQTDFDGTKSEYKIVSIDNSFSAKTLVITTNLVGQIVDENYRGLVIDVYDDGTSTKRLQ